MDKINGCKTFTATKHFEREELGNRVTQWLADNPDITLVDRQVIQSSDSEFHCLSIVLFYHRPIDPKRVSKEMQT